MLKFLVGVVVLSWSLTSWAECFSSLDEIIKSKDTQKVYEITDGESHIYCSTYEWSQFINAKKIADASELDWERIEINYANVESSLVDETKMFLKEWSLNDYGRQLSLWASLNKISKIHISKTLAVFPEYMMTFNASMSSLYAATAETKFFKMQQVLKYTYLMQRYTGRTIYVCDQFDDFSGLEELMNERFKTVMFNLIQEKQVMICKSGIVYETYEMAYPENPNFY